MRRIAIVAAALLLLSVNPAESGSDTSVHSDGCYGAGTGLMNPVTGEVREMEKESGKGKENPATERLSDAEKRKKELVARYLSVCYPLSHIRINSPYGYRKDPFSGKRKFHNGVDLHARSEEACAMMAGDVEKVGQDKVSGKYVIIRHGGITVSYCHLSRTLVHQGQAVRAGDAVGITGNTGRSTGEHLHLTCKINGESIDPMFIIKYIETVRQSCISALL